MHEFYRYLKELVNNYGNNLIVIGFNILRYDISLLIQKGVEHGMAPLSELNAL